MQHVDIAEGIYKNAAKKEEVSLDKMIILN